MSIEEDGLVVACPVPWLGAVPPDMLPASGDVAVLGVLLVVRRLARRVVLRRLVRVPPVLEDVLD